MMCEIKYSANKWRLVSGKSIAHLPTQTIFEIQALGQVLAAQVAHLEIADLIFSDDLEVLTRLAVPAYLEAIGFVKPVRSVIALRPN
jgi:hypothetical protein